MDRTRTGRSGTAPQPQTADHSHHSADAQTRTTTYRTTDRVRADHVHHSTDRAEHTHNQALQQWRAGWSAGHGRSRAQTRRSRQISRQNKKKEQAGDGLLFCVLILFLSLLPLQSLSRRLIWRQYAKMTARHTMCSPSP